ncbi:MAG: glycosyltransferase, partial [Bacillota bacterium]|nr:glycosyltransferase [Bacillota bacterium]
MISVIVPVYNAGRYLDECLSSIINQTYKNLEIILVDDGSIDGCGALCDAWKEKDCRVKVAHTENKGVSHARNLGLELSTGQYLSFVDADDWIDEDMYTCMMEVIKDAGVDVCIGGVLKEYTSQTVNDFICEDERCSVFVRQELIKEMFSVKHKKLFSWFLVDKLFSRNVIANNRLDENVSHGEDMLFMWYVLKHVKKAGYVPAF